MLGLCRGKRCLQHTCSSCNECVMTSHRVDALLHFIGKATIHKTPPSTRYACDTSTKSSCILITSTCCSQHWRHQILLHFWEPKLQTSADFILLYQGRALVHWDHWGGHRAGTEPTECRKEDTNHSTEGKWYRRVCSMQTQKATQWSAGSNEATL